MKKQVATVALAEFQNRGLNTSAQLFLTRDPAGFLSQFATVEKFNQNQNMALQNYQIEQANLADLQRSTQADIALLKQERVQLAKLRSEADGKVKDAQSVLDKLTAAQRRRIAAEQARQAQQAQQASQNSANTAANAIASSNAPASGKGEIALAFARAQIGKPYVFGATGPSSYDCSGLTQAAWAAAGVQISRTSEEQFHDGVPVSRSQLQPGDLVFFYDSVAPSHVGIYAGGGTVIHAPQPGESVTYIKMSYMPYVGARRPA
ncbi:MAG: C40 family peptidase [Microlunatus sp.]|nr:C40 family peptidase [Microlunatus sp.]